MDAVTPDTQDELLVDERVHGIAFTDAHGERVDPEQVFKSVANTYVMYNGTPVRLWKSENAGAV